MNWLAPCDHASLMAFVHCLRRATYGGTPSENFFEVAYRLRRRRAVPIGSDAVIEALFNAPNQYHVPRASYRALMPDSIDI